MVIIIKRHNIRNLFCLLLAVLALYLMDNTKLKKYIGFEKVQENIKKDINIFGLAEGLFGNKIYTLYNTELTTNNNIIKEFKIGNGCYIYIEENVLYSTFLATVINVEKNDSYYTVTLSKPNGNIKISRLIECDLNVYQKVEVNTILGIVDGFYYYEEI